MLHSNAIISLYVFADVVAVGAVVGVVVVNCDMCVCDWAALKSDIMPGIN